MRLAAILVLSPALLTCARPEAADRCAVRVEIAEAGRPAYGLLRVLDFRGGAVPLQGLLCRGLGLEKTHPAQSWYVVPGTATILVPKARLTFEALRGLETELTRVDADLSGRDAADVRLPLRVFYDPMAEGWRSGNTHLHLKQIPREEAERYLREVPRADGLEALFVSYLERADADREYISNGLTSEDLAALTKSSGVLLGNGEEHRHNFAKPGEAPGQSFSGEGYGHVMFLNLRKLVRPVSIGPGIMKTGTDGRPLQRGIDEARKDGATILWCHNTYGLEDIPNWVTGRPHAQNIFDGEPGTHGNYQDTFYRYLNAGLRVPFSTGTDWFIYDFSRVHVRAPRVETVRDWLGALEMGRTYITNGPFLEFTVNEHGPGDSVALPEPGPVHIEARAAGRVDFRWIELLRNGEVVKAAATRSRDGHFRSELNLDLDVTKPCWLALRTPAPPVQGENAPGFPQSELGGPLFAHTSPVYVPVGGKHVFDPDVAKGLLEEIKRARQTIATAAVFADDHELSHVMAVYEQAATVLERMLSR